MVSHHLGDRVKHWITDYEPWVVAFIGYQVGRHARGLKKLDCRAFRVSHHLSGLEITASVLA